MERKIGEIFIYKSKTYQVVKATYGCRGCAFYSKSCFNINNKEECCQYTRTDNTNVIFKEINNMENNQLTIDIPEGMEIDLENSNFDTGVIYFKKKQSEFKDGDILYVKTKKLGSEYIIINRLSEEVKTTFYVAYNLSSKKIFWNLTYYFVCCDKEISILRQATDYEKSQLFGALAKEGKAWDSEKKAIVDFKSKWTPKPFDRVITRVDSNAIWTANIFSHIDQYGEYVTIGCVGGYPYCIPYNEETAKLIGTTNNWES